MKIVTVMAEAFLVLILFALFTVPFFVLNGLNANQQNAQTIAQNISNK